MSLSPDFLARGMSFRGVTRSVQPPSKRASREPRDVEVTSSTSQTPALPHLSTKKREWLLRSLSPTEFKFPQKPIVRPQQHSVSPRRSAPKPVIPVIITKEATDKPSLLECYKFKPVVVETYLPESSISASVEFPDIYARAAYAADFRRQRPLSIYLDIKHKLPPVAHPPRKKSESLRGEDGILREVKRLRKQRDEEIERVMEQVREEFELDNIHETAASRFNTFRDL